MILASIDFKFWKPLAIAGSVVLSLFSMTEAIPSGEKSTSALQARLATAPPPVNKLVPEVAREVTVRVIGNPGVSSGVLIARRGRTYTVLTCQHCLSYNHNSALKNRFEVLTSDGLTHSAESLASPEFGAIDMALLRFTSRRSYRVAEIGDSQNLSVGDPVYVAGFPKWHWVSPDRVEDTGDWGWQAYRLTAGEVGMLLSRPLERGYGLGYTNDIETGMSGGPVLDRYGRLVGINGRSKYPWNGIDAFVFEDGSLPSAARFRQMETLSWAIPIATFDRVRGQGSANSSFFPESAIGDGNDLETQGW